MSGSPRETTPILWIRACRPRQEPPSHNPFAVLDREGVGGLVRIAAEDARTHKSGIKLADDAEPVLAGFGNAVPRLGRYVARLAEP